MVVGVVVVVAMFAVDWKKLAEPCQKIYGIYYHLGSRNTSYIETFVSVCLLR